MTEKLSVELMMGEPLLPPTMGLHCVDAYSTLKKKGTHMGINTDVVDTTYI